MKSERSGLVYMEKIFNSKNRESLTNDVVAEIRGAIISGKIKPGEKIIEAKLSREMNISRYPIREAFRYLEKEGLVVTIPYKGTFVVKLTVEDIEEIFALRMAVENLAIEQIIKKNNNEIINKLSEILDDMQKQKSIKGHVSKDLEFHKTICELTGNKRLLNVWENLEDQLSLCISMDKQFLICPAEKENIEAHLLIFDSIRQKNVTMAQEIYKKHLEEGLNNIKEYMLKNS